uniref:Uncharacterized protein n=1 Tax=Trichuris muris TaxID=70415 RepID=A0A5S6QVL5_TRIMR
MRKSSEMAEWLSGRETTLKNGSSKGGQALATFPGKKKAPISWRLWNAGAAPLLVGSGGRRCTVELKGATYEPLVSGGGRVVDRWSYGRARRPTSCSSLWVLFWMDDDVERD